MNSEEIEAAKRKAKEARRLGDEAREQGLLKEAERRYEAAYESNLAIHKVVGDTDEALRSLAIDLQRLGVLARDRGEMTEAERCYREGHALNEQRQALLGDTPEVLRDLTIGLQLYGDLVHNLGDVNLADRCYGNMLVLTQRRQEILGDTPEVLRDLTIGLQRLGGLALNRGEVAVAEFCFRESHSLTQRRQAILGNTPEILLDLAIELERQGSLASNRGDVAEAERHYREMHAVNLRRQAILGDTPAVLRDLASDLLRLGDLVRDRGDVAEAERCFREMYALDLRRQATLGDTPEVLRDLVSDLDRLGNLTLDRGEAAEAEHCFREMHALNLRQQAILGNTPAVLGDLSIGLRRLGDLARDRGEVSEAERCYRETHTLTLRRRAILGDTPTVLRTLFIDLQRLSDLARNRGDVTEEVRCCLEMHALNLRRQAILGDTPEVLHDLSMDLQRLGDHARDWGGVNEAERHYREMHALNLRRQAILGDTPEVLNSLATGLLRLGDLARDRGEVSEAERHYREMHAVNLRRQAILGDTPEVLRNLAVDLNHLGNLALDRGELTVAATHYFGSANHLLAMRTRTARWPSDCARTGERLTVLANRHPSALAEALNYLARLSETLAEHLDLQPLEVSERARIHFTSFHADYLNLALTHAHDRMPLILSALQGRKLAALVLDEMESRAQDYPEGDLRRRFLAVRTELRRLALGLQVIQGARDDVDPSLPDRGGSCMEADQALYHAQLKEYEVRLQEYRALRLELSMDPEFVITAPHLEITHSSLQSSLQDGEGMLLLLHTSSDAEVTKAQPAAHALLIRSSGEPTLFPLPALVQAPAEMQKIDTRLGRRGGYRESGLSMVGKQNPSTPIEESGSPVEAMETFMREALWAPLADDLKGITRLHLVTHGDLHGVPVSLGCPVEETFTWPGLVFYHLHKTQPVPVYEGQRAGILAYTAADLKDDSLSRKYGPIPLVEAEGAMIQSLWPDKVNPLDFSQDAPVTCIHLAGHGSSIKERLEEAHLLIGPDKVLTFHDVLGSPLRAPVVFLSACLVGQTKEDLDGDPLGMVSAFMLRGARYVVAPLVPVSDFYMPLLAALFHQGLVAGLSAHKALEEAKRRLTIGDWYKGTEDLIKKHYTGVLEDYLKGVSEGKYLTDKGLRKGRRLSIPNVLEAWFPDLPEDERIALADRVRTQGVSCVIDHLLHNKTNLIQLQPVREIVSFTVGFGM